MSRWLSIVGLGEGRPAALSGHARELIESAELLVGASRHLEPFAASAGATIAWENPLARTVERIAAFEGRPVCVLATGDPMHYGIGTTLVRRFGSDAVRVIPAVSAFALACARMGWAADETVQLTLHGRPPELLNAHLAPGQKLLVLSRDAGTPAVVGRLLAEAGFGPSAIHVLCRMGADGERRLTGTAASLPGGEIDDLNTLAIELKADPRASVRARSPGLPDDAFRNDGQMTRREVRAVTLASLQPMPGQLLWDVGAGCGSISIEWMRAADRTTAVAVERHAGRRAMIADNAAALGVPSLEIVAGTAPDALADLARPDAIFIGGGLASEGLADLCWESLDPGGRLVANAVTLESERALIGLHARHGGDLVRLAVAHAEPVGRLTGWKSRMPVTHWRATRR